MRLKDMIILNLFYMALFVVAAIAFKPDEYEKIAIGVIIMAWVIFMLLGNMTILTFAMLSYTRSLMTGEDGLYGTEERKTALYFNGMVLIALSIFLTQIIPSALSYATGTSLL